MRNNVRLLEKENVEHLCITNDETKKHMVVLLIILLFWWSLPSCRRKWYYNNGGILFFWISVNYCCVYEGLRTKGSDVSHWTVEDEIGWDPTYYDRMTADQRFINVLNRVMDKTKRKRMSDKEWWRKEKRTQEV